MCTSIIGENMKIIINGFEFKGDITVYNEVESINVNGNYNFCTSKETKIEINNLKSVSDSPVDFALLIKNNYCRGEDFNQ